MLVKSTFIIDQWEQTSVKDPLAQREKVPFAGVQVSHVLLLPHSSTASTRIIETTVSQNKTFDDPEAGNVCDKCVNEEEYSSKPTAEGSSGAMPQMARIQIGRLPSSNAEPAVASNNTDPVPLVIGTTIPSEDVATIIRNTQLKTPTQASRKARGRSQGKKSSKVDPKASVRSTNKMTAARSRQ